MNWPFGDQREENIVFNTRQNCSHHLPRKHNLLCELDLFGLRYWIAIALRSPALPASSALTQTVRPERFRRFIPEVVKRTLTFPRPNPLTVPGKSVHDFSATRSPTRNAVMPDPSSRALAEGPSMLLWFAFCWPSPAFQAAQIVLQRCHLTPRFCNRLRRPCSLCFQLSPLAFRIPGIAQASVALKSAYNLARLTLRLSRLR